MISGWSVTYSQYFIQLWVSALPATQLIHYYPLFLGPKLKATQSKAYNDKYLEDLEGSLTASPLSKI